MSYFKGLLLWLKKEKTKTVLDENYRILNSHK